MPTLANEDTSRLSPLGRIPQFSLANIFLIVTVIAVSCVFYRYDIYLPWWLMIPYGGMLATYLMVRRNVSVDLLWGILTLSWCVVLWDISYSQQYCFMSMGIFDHNHAALCLIHIYLTGISLPTVITLWSLPRLLCSGIRTRSYSRKWLLLTLLIGNLDVMLLTMSSSWLVKYHFRY